MSNKNRRKMAQKRHPVLDFDYCLAVLFVIAIGLITFLIRVRLINYTSPRISAPVLDTGWQVDIYSNYKLIFVVIVALLAMITLCCKILTQKYTLRASYLNLPLLLLVIMIVISTLSADYKTISLLGLYNQGTGALVLLAYLALCLAAANTSFKPWFRRSLTLALSVITLANAVLLLSHFGGADVMQVQFMKTLLAPPELQAQLSGQVASTLGNDNYISGLSAALFAYFMAGVMLSTNWRRQMPYIVAAVTAWAMVLASLSSSGFVTLVIISPLIIAITYISRARKQTVMAGGLTIILCVIVFIAMNSYTPEVGKGTIGFLKQSLHLQQTTSGSDITKQNELTDHENMANNADKSSPVPSSFNLPKPGWGTGTGRVYIWKETLKLVEDRPWLGYGQGTLAYYFPQNDINKVAALKYYDTLITKAHNMYLDIAFGSGIPALVFMLTLFLLHFFHTGRRLLRSGDNDPLILPVAIFLFLCAFAVQGLFNDIVIDSGAIFWILLGVSISLNFDLDKA